MNLLNENVKHFMFGLGVITEAKDNKIWVKFQEEIGIKIFLYPEAFEKILKAENPVVEKDVLEELHIKQEQIEREVNEKKRKDAEIQERLVETTKKTLSKKRKKP